MNFNKLQGMIAAPFTPMHKDGSINPDPIKEYADFLKTNNISGAFVNGTTGEGISMTINERKILAEEWLKTATSDFRIIVHVGGPSIEACKSLAKHAKENGAFAIALMGPNFFKPATVDILIEFISEVAGLVPDLPFFYYHIPSMSEVYLPIPELLSKVSVKIPNFAGIKFSHHDLMEFNQCLLIENGKFNMLYGYDETLLCGLVLGAEAAVGSTYNYFSPVYHKLWEAFNNGDLEKARKMQQLSVKLVVILDKYGGGVVCGKAIMNLLGVNCGPCRLPLGNLSSSEIDQLRKDLEQINFFEISEYL